MKVPLIPQRGYHPPHWRAPIVLRRSLPFAQTGPTNYVHRPRSGKIFTNGDTPRLCIDAWCGQILQRPRLFDEPPPGTVVCATCEGRAIGSGQVPAGDLTGHPIKFSPVWPTARCEFKRGRRGYGYVDYFVCGARARFVAVRDSEQRPVCKTHQRQAMRLGFAIQEAEDWRS